MTFRLESFCFESDPFTSISGEAPKVWAGRHEEYIDLVTFIAERIMIPDRMGGTLFGCIGSGKTHSLLYFSRILNENGLIKEIDRVMENPAIKDDSARLAKLARIKRGLQLRLGRRPKTMAIDFSFPSLEGGKAPSFPTFGQSIMENVPGSREFWVDRAEKIVGDLPPNEVTDNIALGKGWVYKALRALSENKDEAWEYFLCQKLRTSELRQIGCSLQPNRPDISIAVVSSALRMLTYEPSTPIEGLPFYDGVFILIDEAHTLANVPESEAASVSVKSFCYEFCINFLSQCPPGLGIVLAGQISADASGAGLDTWHRAAEPAALDRFPKIADLSAWQDDSAFPEVKAFFEELLNHSMFRNRDCMRRKAGGNRLYPFAEDGLKEIFDRTDLRERTPRGMKIRAKKAIISAQIDNVTMIDKGFIEQHSDEII